MENKLQNGTKKRIAFLCFSALPYAESWGGTQRVHYMANTLCSEFDVTIFAPKSSDVKVNEDIERLYRTVFFEDNLSRKLFKANNSTLQISNNAKVQKKSIKSVIRNIVVSTMKMANRIIYNEPVYFKGFVASAWIRRYGDEICQKIKKNDISALIISIPPWDLMSISFVKKVKRLGCKVIIDYRDPWNCWNNHKGIPLRKEKALAQLADMIFVTNENHGAKIAEDLKVDSHHIKVIMNGYDAERWNEVNVEDSMESDKLEIAFIGSIDFKNQTSFRDPRNFMTALESFEDKGNIRFRVIGCRDENYIVSIKDRVPNFDMIKTVPQLESFRWMMRSDVLVNFHTTDDDSSKYLIAGKTFDYYRSGARILSINGVQSYERVFVENNNAGYYSPNTVENILQTLRKIYNDWCDDKSNFRRKSDANPKYSRQYQNQKVLGVLKNILSNHDTD